MRKDVARAPDKGGLADGEVLETIPVRGVRAVIAERMAQSSATAAHVTLNSEADATALVELRRQLASDGVDVSYNALLLHILGRALRDHPRLNASLVGDTIQVWRRVHVGLAVDSDRGLLVPVVRDVDRKGLTQLEDEIRSLADRARAGHCSPEELSGGTFTLTNLGMFGIDSFTPIINLPECAILGVGRIKDATGIRRRPARRAADDVAKPEFRPPAGGWRAGGTFHAARGATDRASAPAVDLRVLSSFRNLTGPGRIICLPEHVGP